MKKDQNAPEEKINFFIVGIGASAGGIQALQEFFSNVPRDSGMAYVVILHLSPDHDSKLAEVLRNITPLAVTQVTEKVHVQPDHVYVVPPNQHLTMEDGYIIVSPNTSFEERRAPVDLFFRTLAEQHGAAAIAVILSGTGANGSMGLKRIKEKGGAVFVQNPREAEHSDMPRNSIATELVDEILNAAQIPGKIIGYKQSTGKVSIPLLVEELQETQQAALRDIFTQLRVRTGHDFSNYKRATVMRRIERRITVRQLDSLSAYAKFLRETPEESQSLLKDLLISVTNFFRDKDSFFYLETVIIPAILKNKTPDNPIRIWIAGCATGEEAYSIAMLLYEKFDGIKEIPPIQLFATDIDATAIANAREGLYTLNDAADVSTERLRRFFIAETGGYRVRRELREMILFANHNVLKDPPFSRVDLITCRNMLIYLNQSAQSRVMETFHFALNPAGYLFLGSSESIDGASDLYLTVNKEHQFFQSRQATGRPFPIVEGPVPSAFRINVAEAETSVKTSHEQESRALERISLGDLHQRLLEQYAPPSLIVNENFDVVHVSEKAGRFLQVTGGEPSNNILRLIKPELRLELRTALHQAIQKQLNVEVKHLPMKANDSTETINLHVRPVLRANDTARGFILVLFETSEEKPAKDAFEIYPGESEPIAIQLEEELTTLKARLRSSNEQFDVQTEELKASNEELQAMNEELRSAAEELETSKEELQSINEELITVNQELKIKIEELSQSNNDLQNLIKSTNIGTVFLDRYLRVKLFTPAAQEIFNLIPADLGRPLSDITNRLEYNDLVKDCEDVLKNLQTIERQVSLKDNRFFLLQISPYRTAEDRINGIVLSFVNVSRLKQAEEAVRKSEERLRITVDSASEYAIINLNTDGIIEGWNSGAERIFKYTSDEVKGKNGNIIFTEEDKTAGIPEKEMKAAQEHGHAFDERWHRRKDGTNFFMSGVMHPIYNPELTGYVKIARNITDQKLIEQQKDDFIAVASHELKTPVTSIKAYAELLREMYNEPNRKPDVDIIIKLDEQVDRLIALIRSLLDTTKLSEGQMTISNEEFNITDLIAERIEEIKHTANGHVIKLDSPEIINVNADKRRIGEVLTNLMSNAIKYSLDEGEIIINAAKTKEGVQVSVQDNGIGIPEDAKTKIFERFFRVSNVQANTFPGIGLGLYISASIIAMHNGKLWFESKPGKGSTFYFLLPYRKG